MWRTRIDILGVTPWIFWNGRDILQDRAIRYAWAIDFRLMVGHSISLTGMPTP